MVLWDAEHLFKLLHLLSTRHRELQPLLPLFRAPYAERLLQELTRAAREPDVHAASKSLRRWLEHQIPQLRIPVISDAAWRLWQRQLTPSGGSTPRQLGVARGTTPRAMAASDSVIPDDEPHPLLGPVEAVGTSVASPSLLFDEDAPAFVETKERFSPRRGSSSSAADQLFASRARDAASRPKTPGPRSFAAPRHEPPGASATAEADPAIVETSPAIVEASPTIAEAAPVEELIVATVLSASPPGHAPAEKPDASAMAEKRAEAVPNPAMSFVVADTIETQGVPFLTTPLEPSDATRLPEARSPAPTMTYDARLEEIVDEGPSLALVAKEPSPFLQELQVAFGLLASIMPIGFWLSRSAALLFAEEALPAFFEGHTLDAAGLRVALREKGPVPLEIVDVFIEELRRYKFSFVLEFA